MCQSAKKKSGLPSATLLLQGHHASGSTMIPLRQGPCPTPVFTVTLSRQVSHPDSGHNCQRMGTGRCEFTSGASWDTQAHGDTVQSCRQTCSPLPVRPAVLPHPPNQIIAEGCPWFESHSQEHSPNLRSKVHLETGGIRGHPGELSCVTTKPYMQALTYLDFSTHSVVFLKYYGFH